MLGTLVVAGVGALAFKLGMDSKQKLNEGKNTGEVIASLPGDAVATVASAAVSCYGAVAGLFGPDKSNKQDNKDSKDSKENSNEH